MSRTLNEFERKKNYNVASLWWYNKTDTIAIEIFFANLLTWLFQTIYAGEIKIAQKNVLTKAVIRSIQLL